MILFLSILLLALMLPIHELGHAMELKKQKIPIEEITLFGVGKKLFSFHSNYFDCLMVVRLFPIGAYVKPDKIVLQSSLENQIRFTAGGPQYSIFYQCFLMALLIPFVSYPMTLILTAIVLIMLGLSLRLEVLKYFIVFIGVSTTLLMAYSMFSMPIGETIDNSGTFLSIGKISKDFAIASSLKMGIIFAALLNFSIILLNCMPLAITDGGRILSHMLLQRKRVKLSRYINIFGGLLFFLLLVFAVIGDVKYLIFG